MAAMADMAFDEHEVLRRPVPCDRNRGEFACSIAERDVRAEAGFAMHRLDALRREARDDRVIGLADRADTAGGDQFGAGAA